MPARMRYRHRPRGWTIRPMCIRCRISRCRARPTIRSMAIVLRGAGSCSWARSPCAASAMRWWCRRTVSPGSATTRSTDTWQRASRRISVTVDAVTAAFPRRPTHARLHLPGVAEAEATGDRNGFTTRSRIQFAQDRRDVVIDRLFRAHELAGDLRVAQAVRQQREDLELALGQSRRIGRGRRPWSARDPAHAGAAQVFPAAPHGCGRAKRFEYGQCLAHGGLVALEQGQGALVRAAEPVPGLRRFPPLPRELQGIWRFRAF